MSAGFSPGLKRLRRRALIRRAVVVGVLAAVLIAAVLLWPRPVPGALRVAETADRPVAGGVVQGRIAGERRGDAVCYAVAARTGTAVLVFPEGWSANGDRGLLDASGGVVALPGDLVRVLGTPGAIGTAPGCTTRGRVWAVASVRVLTPA